MSWSRLSGALLAVAFISLAPPVCEAGKAKPSGRIIVLDVTEYRDSQNRAFIFDLGATLTGWPGTLLANLENRVAARPGDSTGPPTCRRSQERRLVHTSMGQ
jgi:hypothetical protein